MKGAEPVMLFLISLRVKFNSKKNRKASCLRKKKWDWNTMNLKMHPHEFSCILN